MKYDDDHDFGVTDMVGVIIAVSAIIFIGMRVWVS